MIKAYRIKQKNKLQKDFKYEIYSGMKVASNAKKKLFIQRTLP